MAVGDITDASGKVVRTVAIKRPSGGYYSKDSPETTVLKKKSSSSSKSSYVPKVGDITDRDGNLVRTVAIKRPSGGYYSVDSPETTALNRRYGIDDSDRPKSDVRTLPATTIEEPIETKEPIEVVDPFAQFFEEMQLFFKQELITEKEIEPIRETLTREQIEQIIKESQELNLKESEDNKLIIIAVIILAAFLMRR